jgi:hypothetical protein
VLPGFWDGLGVASDLGSGLTLESADVTRWVSVLLAAASMETVRASAKTLRTGLTAFITLVTTGVIIRGRDTTLGLQGGWRALVTVLVGGGLLAVVGLWQALAAEAGTDPKKQTLQEIRAGYGTLAAYQVHLADVAARRLQWGQRAVAAAVVFLLAGIAVTWWAPAAAAPAPPAYISVIYVRHPAIGRGRPAAPDYPRRPQPHCHPLLTSHAPRRGGQLPLTGGTRALIVGCYTGLGSSRIF